MSYRYSKTTIPCNIKHSLILTTKFTIIIVWWRYLLRMDTRRSICARWTLVSWRWDDFNFIFGGRKLLQISRHILEIGTSHIFARDLFVTSFLVCLASTSFSNPFHSGRITENEIYASAQVAIFAVSPFAPFWHLLVLSWY